MGTLKKCFIRDKDGAYREMLYSELVDENGRRAEYKGRHFIPISGYLIEVSQEDYRHHYKIKNRQKYVSKEAARVGVVSIEDKQRLPGAEIVSQSRDVVEEVLSRIMMDELHKAIAKLADHEQRLIRLLYFKNKTERECAEIFHVCRNAIHKRKMEVLRKLKLALR